VRIGASVASLGVLLSLLAGIGRTTFAMAAHRDLPAWLAAVHPRYRVPHRAELLIGAIVAVIVLVSDVRSAIGFSSFAVLVYYGIANASAWTLAPSERRWPRWLAVAGVAGCAVLALSLPLASIAAGALVLAIGAIGYALK
jgi:APA family basic amino acid/polyamine antiporter